MGSLAGLQSHANLRLSETLSRIASSLKDRKGALIAGIGEEIRGNVNEFIRTAKQIFGEVLGCQKTFDEGANQQAQGETQARWGKAKVKAGRRTCGPAAVARTHTGSWPVTCSWPVKSRPMLHGRARAWTAAATCRHAEAID